MNSYNNLYKSRLNAIVNHFTIPFFKDKTIIDLGCGHGDIIAHLSQLGSKCVGLDIDKKTIDFARQKHPNISYINIDCHSFPNKKYDLALSIDVLNYVKSYKDHIELLAKTSDSFVLECAVTDSQDESFVVSCSIPSLLQNSKLNTLGKLPSTAAIESVFKSLNLDFISVVPELEDANYKYNWKERNKKIVSVYNRKFWFVTKKQIQKTLPQIYKKYPVIERKKEPENKIVLESSNLKDTKSIKVAVCISGYLRTFTKTYESWKKMLFDKYDCDVFIHTWSTLGCPPRDIHRMWDKRIYKTKTQSLLAEINKLYNPKDIVIQDNKSWICPKEIAKFKGAGHDTPSITSMYYKIKACNDLKINYENKNNFKYDFVIRLRADLELNSLSFPEEKGIFLPQEFGFGGYCDQIAIGSSEIMDTYSNLYSNLESYLIKGANICPEHLLKYHLDKSNISPRMMPFQIKLLREN